MAVRSRLAGKASAARRRVLASAFAVGVLGGLACKSTFANSNHCFYNQGNETCADRYEDLPYCATTCAGTGEYGGSPNNDGCVDWMPPMGCYSPCGGEDDDDSCLTVADTSATTEPTSTEPTSMTTMSTTADTEAAQCSTSADCSDPSAPLCVDDECRACGDAVAPDAECELKDDALPLCGPTGACVQCTESNTEACNPFAPVCDAGTCRGCDDHGDCDTKACDFATGECFPNTCVRSVPDEYPTIAAALAFLHAEYPTDRCIVEVEADVDEDPLAPAFVDGGPARAIVYGGVTTPYSISNSGDVAALTVSGGASVYVVGLGFTGISFRAMVVLDTGSTLYVDDCTIVGNPGEGIRAASGGHVQIRNTIIGGNGLAAENNAAVYIYNGSAEITATTIANNIGTVSPTLRCNGADVTVRNSILVGNSPQSVSCDGADITFSATDEYLVGDGNVEMPPLDPEWFTNAAGDDYHLSPAGQQEFGGIARWTDEDPRDDIDGDPRVNMDGTMEPAGADVPPP